MYDGNTTTTATNDESMKKILKSQGSFRRSRRSVYNGKSQIFTLSKFFYTTPVFEAVTSAI
jgi:hypothetical protein